MSLPRLKVDASMLKARAKREAFKTPNWMHVSKETMIPSWYAYPMRKRAPYKEEFDKWSVCEIIWGLYYKLIEYLL